MFYFERYTSLKLCLMIFTKIVKQTVIRFTDVNSSSEIGIFGCFCIVEKIFVQMIQEKYKRLSFGGLFHCLSSHRMPILAKIAKRRVEFSSGNLSED